jgi:hypothetical protein
MAGANVGQYRQQGCVSKRLYAESLRSNGSVAVASQQNTHLSAGFVNGRSVTLLCAMLLPYLPLLLPLAQGGRSSRSPGASEDSWCFADWPVLTARLCQQRAGCLTLW